MSINILTELEALSISYEWAGDEEVKVSCPFHFDTTPSCCINVSKQVYKCYACDSSGDFYSFYAKTKGVKRSTAIKELKEKYNLGYWSIIDPHTIERFHQEIWREGLLLRELEKRGINANLIKYYRLGVNDNRIIIPVYNEKKECINLRKYLPGADKNKMLSAKDHGTNAIYPIEQLKYEKIVLCGGEIKAIVSAYLLNASGVGAVCTTGGEGSWHGAFSEMVRDKIVYVCYDIDQPGIAASEKIARIVNTFAKAVYILKLPLDKEKYPKGDINDYVAMLQGEGKADSEIAALFLELIANGQRFEPATQDDIQTHQEIHECNFESAYDARMTSQRVRFPVTVIGSSGEAFLLPKEVIANCDRAQKQCGDCPVYYRGLDFKHTIPAESVELLEMADNTRRAHRDPIMNAIGIPPKCKSFEPEILSQYSVTATYITPSVEIETSNRHIDIDPKQAYIIGDRLETNETYTVTGRLHPNPKNQIGMFMISTADKVKPTDLKTIEKFADELRVFQTSDSSYESLKKKLDDIYFDLEFNVTRIFNRRELHLAIDFAYLSCLNFRFENTVCKGWVESIIIGDSAQGKTRASSSMREFYGLGERIDGSNTSIAGVIGSVQKIGDRWAILWGALVRGDRRIVIFEELSDAPHNLMTRLTETRSSGVATISKAKSGRAHCRTRLIVLSNPIEDQIDNYSYGCISIKDICGNALEDVRRFDYGVVLNKRYQNVSLGVSGIEEIGDVNKCKYPSDLHHKLILWIWSRQLNEIVIDRKLQEYIRLRAKTLCGMFSSQLPLIEIGWTHEKISRLAIALASRVFSTTDGKILSVLKCHVDFVCDLLEKTYQSDEHGYRDFSRAVFDRENLRDEQELRNCIGSQETANQILYSNTIDQYDICNIFKCDIAQARVILSDFFQANALQRKSGKREGQNSNVYVKTPAFLQFLKEFKCDTIPEHIRRSEL